MVQRYGFGARGERGGRPAGPDGAGKRRARELRALTVLVAFCLALSACGGGDAAAGYPVAAAGARAGEQVGSGPSANPTPTSQALPPIRFPQDEAPHGDLTEWWYYTGHLFSGGRTYGFELVTFQAVRGELPRSYVAHFAITDAARKKFAYDDRVYTGTQPEQGPGFNLDVGGWKMRGLNGRDSLQASMKEYAIDLALSARKPPLLHERDGILSFGAAGDSYYYSRTRMDIRGTLVDHGKPLPVTGQAWMDHQWGNFISVAGSGWDWYSMQLEDGSDVVLNVVRSVDGKTVLRYGTYVARDGEPTFLKADQFGANPTGTWRSPRTGTTYPSGWRVSLPDQRLQLAVKPVLPDQELDTRTSTGVAYWEGAVEIAGTRGGKPIRGRGYVELTGYERPER